LLESTMPASIYAEAETTIEDILSKSRGGLLSVGFIFALYFATNGTTALINAFNRTYRTKERRSFLRSKLVALSLTFLLAFVLFTSIVLLIVAQLAINYLESWGLFNDSFEIYLFI